MMDFIKKQWTALLGSIFVIVAFSYTFKFLVELGIINDFVKIILGIGAGIFIIIVGINVIPTNYNTVRQITTGLGVSLLYVTFTFAGINYNIWSTSTVFLSMSLVTIILTIYSYKSNARFLLNLSVLGALIAPLCIKPTDDQTLSLFVYLIVINICFLIVSSLKNCIELKLVSFFGTWILYFVYYFYYDPTSIEKPMLYLSIMFIYFVASFVAAVFDNKSKNGIFGLVMSTLNATLYTAMAVFICFNIVDISYILIFVGFICTIYSLSIYKITKETSFQFIINFSIGIFLLIVAGLHFAKNYSMKPMIIVAIWMSIAIISLVISNLKNNNYLKILATVLWWISTIYWFFYTWTTPIGKIFGIFIPIINFSGLTWLLLAGFGFYCSKKLNFDNGNLVVGKDLKYILRNAFALISHFIIGGLLTFQIDNLWDEYNIKGFDLWLMLSVTWGIYSLLLFAWGAYDKQRVFKIFGSIVLIVVAIKTILIDLSKSDTIYKIIALLILAVISFLITYINNKYSKDVLTSDNEIEMSVKDKE
jgi:uncharacterized membrane protein